MSTNAERQRRYRERALRDPDGLQLSRLQVLIDPAAAAALKKMSKQAGVTQRRIVEAALLEFERQWHAGNVTL